MIVVIFEGIPHEGKMQEYLSLAPKYSEPLKSIDGFISNERFVSAADPNKVLSVSFWRDEESIHRFRQLDIHIKDERLGREDLFKDYKISIATVTRNYSLNDRKDAPHGKSHTL
jgi:heme-degrading monooxygenase HmoA